MKEKDVIKRLEEAKLEGIETPESMKHIKKTLMAAAYAKREKKDNIFFKLAPTVAFVFAAAVMTYFVVDNMNDGAKFNKRGGYWSTYTDAPEGGTSRVWPPAEEFVMSQPGYGDTGYAVRITGTSGTALGLNYNYLGVVVRFDEKSQCPKCQGSDIKKYSGIRFKVKGNITSGRLFFILPYESGECIPDRMTCKSLTGYADYEKDITADVTPEWTTVMINFRLDMKQPFWAAKDAVVSMDKVLESVHLFKWQYKNGNGRPIDLWIDDVELY